MAHITSRLVEPVTSDARGPRRAGWRSATTSTYVPPRRSGALIIGAVALMAGGAVAIADLDDGPSPDQVASNPAVDERGSLATIAAQLDVDQLWARGVTGSGVNVAIVDTGVAPVDALRDQVVVAIDLTAEADDVATAEVDTYGHGTHLAGIAAGNDADTGFRGIAPDAGVVSVKVAGRDGSVLPSDLVAGVEWVVDNAAQHDVGVLLLALDASQATASEEQALLDVIDQAWDAGIVVVTATGNGGEAGLPAPASSQSVVAVAAVDGTIDGGFGVADYSTRGDGIRNPDVAAPGAHVISLRAPGSTADLDHPEGYVDEQRFLGTGSSQSAAVIAGLAALTVQAAPDATPDQLRQWLQDAATPVGTDAETGAGVPNGSALLDLVALDGAWTGQSWTGQSWTGQSWTGQSWTGQSWTGQSWTGQSWTGQSWTGQSWTGQSWTGQSWTGQSWTGQPWTGQSWTGQSWTGQSWT